MKINDVMGTMPPFLNAESFIEHSWLRLLKNTHTMTMEKLLTYLPDKFQQVFGREIGFFPTLPLESIGDACTTIEQTEEGIKTFIEYNEQSLTRNGLLHEVVHSLQPPARVDSVHFDAVCDHLKQGTAFNTLANTLSIQGRQVDFPSENPLPSLQVHKAVASRLTSQSQNIARQFGKLLHLSSLGADMERQAYSVCATYPNLTKISVEKYLWEKRQSEAYGQASDYLAKAASYYTPMPK